MYISHTLRATAHILDRYDDHGLHTVGHTAYQDRWWSLQETK